MQRKGIIVIAAVLVLAGSAWAQGLPYTIVGTGQEACFNDTKQSACPEPGRPYFGQDGQYKGNSPKYRDNGDGTVSDLNTGLMWVKARGEKMSWSDAMKAAADCRVGGYDDWRAPSIKELYSLIDFNGWVQMTAATSRPFIDTKYFDFKWGDTSKDERIIDCQDWSSTKYVGTTMGNSPTAFGVNFCDGRIKGYPAVYHRKNDARYIRYVRGNPDYGRNEFVDNRDGTVSDKATGLTWQQKDDGRTYNWEQALAYCENLNLAGHSDWRLPSVKELESIVDYSRSPTTTGSAAIDPVFSVSDKESYFYSSTTHIDGERPDHACYVAFGRAMGYFQPPRSSGKQFMDVHGAGAQRTDPKSGNPEQYAGGHGPQGDDVRIYNYVRCVTGGGVALYDPPNESIGQWKGGRRGSGQMGMREPSGQMGRPNNPNMRPGQEEGRPMGDGPMMGSQGMGGQDMNGGPMMGGQSGEGQPMRRNGPPPEAFEACSGVPIGDACSVETPRGTLTGICRAMNEGTVCVPDHRPGGGPPMQ